MGRSELGIPWGSTFPRARFCIYKTETPFGPAFGVLMTSQPLSGQVNAPRATGLKGRSPGGVCR